MLNDDAQPGTATERAYRFTEAGILDGSLPAGEPISEGQVARPLQLRMSPGALGGRFPGRSAGLVAEHRALRERLRARAAAGARQVLREHLAGTRASVLGAPAV